MHDFQKCERLGPFGKFAHPANNIFEADKGNEKYYAT